MMWGETSDKMAGGSSEAKASRVAAGAGGSAGALRAEGEIKPPFPFAWGGLQLMFGGPRDLSGARELVFKVRGKGSGPQGRAMLFDTTSPQPKQRSFAFTDDWIATPRTVSLLHALYATRGVPVHATWISPADVGVKRIDHEGAFRASNSALWPRIAEVLETETT